MKDPLVGRFFLTAQTETGRVEARCGDGMYLLRFDHADHCHTKLFSAKTMADWGFEFYVFSTDRNDVNNDRIAQFQRMRARKAEPASA